jgi:DNA-binding HxlR family transcriptional regulator
LQILCKVQHIKKISMIVEGKEYIIKMNGHIYHCALDITMSYIGGKWKSVVLWYLRKGTKRFSELKKHIPEITEKMLSLQLKQLEQDGIIGRTVYPEVPPRVEYYLTAEGKTLIPMLEEMAAWGRKKGKKEGEIIEAKKPAVKKKKA